MKNPAQDHLLDFLLYAFCNFSRYPKKYSNRIMLLKRGHGERSARDVEDLDNSLSVPRKDAILLTVFVNSRRLNGSEPLNFTTCQAAG